MKILLSGASGFLGTALRAHWDDVRDMGAYRLGDPVPPALFDHVDLFVHAAHAFGPGKTRLNVDAARELHAAARARRVRQIFISSLSAHAGARSEYGAAKFEIERFFLESGDTVVRPGLVAGGGLFARLAARLQKWRIAPIVEPNVRDVAVISLGDFLRAVNVIVQSNKTGAWNLFAPELLTPAEFARAVWGSSGVVVPVPGALAESALRLAGAHDTLDSLRGRLSRPAIPHVSHLPELLQTWTAARRAIEEAAR